MGAIFSSARRRATSRSNWRAALARAIAADPGERFREVGEFAVEMERGPARAPTIASRPPTLYERYPLRFWRRIAAVLAVALLYLLLRR